MARTNQKPFLVVLFGALLIAGLFYYRQVAHEPQELRPSDLNFSESNELAPHEPQASDTTEGDQRKPMQLEEPKGLSETDAKQWKIFQEVIFGRNDNDPRVDQDLRKMSPAMHQALMDAYQKIPLENRNSRGMVAFLIGRDLQTAADAAFLKGIYQEEPCLSMADCSRAEAETDPHLSGTVQTSLNYPQLAGLYQLEQRLGANPDLLKNPEIKAEIAELLREARQFPGSAIQKRAEELQKKYGL